MIYLVEDDNSIRSLVVYTLRNSGMEAEGFALPSEFRDAVKNNTPDLILLDIMLPEEDGLSLLSWLRHERLTADVPVMMLTAKDSEYDKVTGLDAGADDYLAKPFGIMELLARIRALLRRGKQKPSAEPASLLQAGKIVLDKASHRVTARGIEVMLTLKEFELLRYLMENKGIVLDRDKLLDRVWGYSFDGGTRTVDVHIRTLRQKLGDCGEIIETIRGVGYRIGGWHK